MQRVDRIRRKPYLKPVVFALAVLLLIVIAFFIIQWWAGNKIRNAMDGKTYEFNGGKITLETKGASVRLLSRSVALKDAQINVDYTGNTATQQIKAVVAIPEIRVSDVDLAMLRDPGDIDLGTLTLQSPQVTIDLYEHEKAEYPSVPDSTSVTFVVRQILMQDAQLKIISHNGEWTTKYEVKDLNMGISGLSSIAKVDNYSQAAGSESETGLGFELEEVVVRVASLTVTNPDATVLTEVENIFFDSAVGEFYLDYVRIDPQLDMYRFASRNYKHSDWTAVSTGKIAATGIDIKRFMKEKVVAMDKVSIEYADVKSYKNRNIPQPYRVKYMVFEQIHKLPFGLEVKTVDIGPTDAEYWELGEGDAHAGVVSFKGLTGRFDNLSNIHSEENPFYTLTAGGMLYGAGNLHATFYFPKSPETNRFEVTGRLGGMDLRRINAMIEPLENIEVQAGWVDDLDFHIVGTETHSSVEMTFLYHALDVALMKTKKNGKVKEKKFISWIANMVVKDENPRHGTVRKATGSAQRNFDRSQFNYLWKTLFSGVKETVGL